MAMTAEQLQAAIDSLVQGLSEGVQAIRFADGSGVTFIDAAQAPSRLRMLRAELAALHGVQPRTSVTFTRVNFRSY